MEDKVRGKDERGDSEVKRTEFGDDIRGTWKAIEKGTVHDAPAGVDVCILNQAPL